MPFSLSSLSRLICLGAALLLGQAAVVQAAEGDDAVPSVAGKHISKAGILLFTIDAPSHTASTPPPTTSHLALGFCLETLHEFFPEKHQ